MASCAMYVEWIGVKFSWPQYPMCCMLYPHQQQYLFTWYQLSMRAKMVEAEKILATQWVTIIILSIIDPHIPVLIRDRVTPIIGASYDHNLKWFLTLFSRSVWIPTLSFSLCQRQRDILCCTCVIKVNITSVRSTYMQPFSYIVICISFDVLE